MAVVSSSAVESIEADRWAGSAGRDLNPRLYGFAGHSLGPLGHRRQTADANGDLRSCDDASVTADQSEESGDSASDPRAPLDLLGALAKSHSELDETSRIIEIYTTEGLLRIWWFGKPGAGDVALMCGGALGGMLGPGDALYVDLARHLAGKDAAAMIVDYRRPGDLGRCVLDVCAAADLALRNGAKRFGLLGHSFGGAVVIGAAARLPAVSAGIITFATQSGGCEDAGQTRGVPLLLLHGEQDRILGPENSLMVQSLAGHGEVRMLAGADHLMIESAEEIAEISRAWLTDRFAEHRGRVNEA